MPKRASTTLCRIIQLSQTHKESNIRPKLSLTIVNVVLTCTLSYQMLHFATHVRTRDTRNLVIHNRTNQLWMLRPVIDGEYWSGPDTITVEPQQSKNYELTYRPLTMTQEGKKHLV